MLVSSSSPRVKESRLFRFSSSISVGFFCLKKFRSRHQMILLSPFLLESWQNYNFFLGVILPFLEKKKLNIAFVIFGARKLARNSYINFFLP